MADLLLADAVDAAEPLFEAVRVPRQVVIDHQVGVLKVHAFAGGVRGDEDADFGIGAEQRLDAAALVAVRAAVDGDDGVGVAEHAARFLVQVVQRVAVLGEDDELALAPARVVHVRDRFAGCGRVRPTCGPARRRRPPWPAVRVLGG